MSATSFTTAQQKANDFCTGCSFATESECVKEDIHLSIRRRFSGQHEARYFGSFTSQLCLGVSVTRPYIVAAAAELRA